MVSSNSTSLTVSTVSLVLLLGLGLSTQTAEPATVMFPSFSYYGDRVYETTSLNAIANGFISLSPRDEALQLFGVQSNFTPDERETYKSMMKQKSQKIGKNIFDLFK